VTEVREALRHRHEGDGGGSHDDQPEDDAGLASAERTMAEGAVG